MSPVIRPSSQSRARRASVAREYESGDANDDRNTYNSRLGLWILGYLGSNVSRRRHTRIPKSSSADLAFPI